MRAVRPAVELREAVEFELRVGVNTSEVVAGTEERLAADDAVNVATRLQQAAAPGEILLGAETVALGSRARDGR